ncbi:MAG: hypothetical protein HYZ89_02395, partial [Candidatus Omnitrophica bacterium]|nr:hypothetical protein [Candidatus Omnitrophota bacterium]
TAANATLTNEVVISALTANLTFQGDAVASRTLTLGQQVANADILNFDVPPANVRIGGAPLNFSHLAGTVSGGPGGQLADDTITNDDIAATAAIADTKLATITTAGKVADSALSSNVSLLGQSIETNELADNAVTSAKVLDGTLVNADLSDTAAIAGTKITPDFGAQTILTTGSVGIGTSSPAAKLEVRSSEPGAITSLIQAATGQTADILQITTPSSQLLTLSSSGSVGIGTASPAAKLHVASGAVAVDADQKISLKGAPANGDTYMQFNSQKNYVSLVVNGFEVARLKQ